ncbi:hypothetical protein B0H15DRAFT_805345 [Mycena belliarum]|uniref:Uncharacterized protein n=1 Tax=Mycena belliarum TaxID=1033014 RepID=A0AAD6XIN1_9AGAR|nr:hypothetical protein B0H15DRAFT_805345 [Mycena belliae]
MPSKKVRNSTAEEMHAMRDMIRKKDAEIAGLRRAAEEREAATKKPLRLIPKPKGQAGRPGSVGYNLQDEMTLANEGPRYFRLIASPIPSQRIIKDQTHQYLDVTKTISRQDKTRLDKAINLIARAAPFFKKFEGLWPIRDILATYLRNMQTRRRKDLNLESGKAPAEVVDQDDGEEDNDYADTDLNFDDMETDIDNETAPAPTRPGRKRTVNFRIADSDVEEELAVSVNKKCDHEGFEIEY